MLNRWTRILLSPLLFPASLVYGIVVEIRNKLFDHKFLKSVEFDIPVISVGNITVGGTGKTPHVEYILSLLTENFKTAMLSRGYMRKTRGFIIAQSGIQPEDIGDEPWQVYSKFNNAVIAVGADRVHAIEELKKKVTGLQIVVLDDAFQHRYVKPGLSIVLIDYNRPVFKDFLLPLGTLRERISSLSRADIVIVTKVPGDVTQNELSEWKKKLSISPSQKLFFTQFQYDEFIPVQSSSNRNPSIAELKNNSTKVLLVTGIANPKPVIDYLFKAGIELNHLSYPDHYEYTPKDIQTIRKKFEALDAKKKIILTTEKDAVKLKSLISETDPIYYLPIRVKFMNEDKIKFSERLFSYICEFKL